MNKTKDPSICCLQHIQIHFRSKHTETESEGMEKIFYKEKPKKADTYVKQNGF